MLVCILVCHFLCHSTEVTSHALEEEANIAKYLSLPPVEKQGAQSSHAGLGFESD